MDGSLLLYLYPHYPLVITPGKSTGKSQSMDVNGGLHEKIHWKFTWWIFNRHIRLLQLSEHLHVSEIQPNGRDSYSHPTIISIQWICIMYHHIYPMVIQVCINPYAWTDDHPQCGRIQPVFDPKGRCQRSLKKLRVLADSIGTSKQQISGAIEMWEYVGM